MRTQWSWIPSEPHFLLSPIVLLSWGENHEYSWGLKKTSWDPDEISYIKIQAQVLELNGMKSSVFPFS